MSRFGIDARHFQILFLALLLGSGALLRDFSLRPLQCALAFAAGLAVQALFLRLLDLRAGFLSAAVTCLSVSMLVRADNLWAHPAAAAAGMASKFLVRLDGKHVFNPGNLAAILALTVLPGAWVSPGQWGHDVALAAWVAALGATVSRRAERDDISWAFLAFHLGFAGLRVLWLGQRAAVWLHQLQNGALLLFAFFMISDPMTVPDRRSTRVLYAGLVAVLAYCWQYGLYRPNGLLWALFLLSPLVAVLDRLAPGTRFQWRRTHDQVAPQPAGGLALRQPA